MYKNNWMTCHNLNIQQRSKVKIDNEFITNYSPIAKQDEKMSLSLWQKAEW
jgi:hypothetical protein